MSVMNVAQLLPTIQLSESTREFTQGRNHMNVMNVGKLLLVRQFFEYIITEGTPERKTYVMNLGSSEETDTLLENTQWRRSCHKDWQIVSFNYFFF